MIRPAGVEIAPNSALAVDVRDGLRRAGQKTLPSKYLYDPVGSALFDAISVLPEYGLTRADERILMRYAGSIIDSMAAPVAVVELGSGSGRKTRPILEAAARRHPLAYTPIDISRTALDRCVADLRRVPGVTIRALEAEYLDGLQRAARRRGPGERLLVLFLGSTIGNFEPPVAANFLRAVRQTLRIGDALLLGTDLAEPPDRFAAAYDDPAGVTAAFNLNLLARLNRELGADFDLGRFEHESRWNPEARRVEMHLRSLARQFVHIPGAGLTVSLAAGETIWSESSHKYRLDEPEAMGRAAGFRAVSQWLDSEWPFAETLLEAE